MPQTTYGVAETQPEGFYDGRDAAGTAGGTAQNPGDRITGALLPPGVHAENYNFGELEPASISGQVHAERNGDCIPDPGEPLLEGVTVYLLDKWGERIDTALTDASGRYIFRNLARAPTAWKRCSRAGTSTGWTTSAPMAASRTATIGSWGRS
jgi:hypothetical protein